MYRRNFNESALCTGTSFIFIFSNSETNVVSNRSNTFARRYIKTAKNSKLRFAFEAIRISTVLKISEPLQNRNAHC